MQCEICLREYVVREAHGECYWPVEKFVVIELENLQVGDVVRRFQEAVEHKGVATVRSLSKLDKGMIEVSLLISPPGRFKTFQANNFSRIRVLRRVPCGAAVCEEHLQARAPGKYVCADHWEAWERAA